MFEFNGGSGCGELLLGPGGVIDLDLDRTDWDPEPPPARSANRPRPSSRASRSRGLGRRRGLLRRRTRESDVAGSVAVDEGGDELLDEAWVGGAGVEAGVAGGGAVLVPVVLHQLRV